MLTCAKNKDLSMLVCSFVTNVSVEIGLANMAADFIYHATSHAWVTLPKIVEAIGDQKYII